MPKQKYCKAWENHDSLKQWLAPMVGDDMSAYCKVCRRPLHAQKKALLLHNTSRKHRRNMTAYEQIMSYCQPLKETEYEGDSGNIVARTESVTTAASYLNNLKQEIPHKAVTIAVYPESPEVIHEEHLLHDSRGTDDITDGTAIVISESENLPFSDENLLSWKNLPEFQGWLSVDNNTVMCLVCKKELKPNKTLLLKHAAGTLHKKKCSSRNMQQSEPKINSAAEADYIPSGLATDSMQILKKIIDLRSDTVTKPSRDMKEAMIRAEVGDDAYGNDPTVKELEDRVAFKLGKERGLLVPSGTMANMIAVMTHCWSRDAEVIVGDQSHLYNWSQGNLARLCGIAVKSIKNESDGTFSLETLKEMIKQKEQLQWPIQTVVCIENTHTRVGGKALPLEWLLLIGEFCQENGIILHMDGARLMNACIYTGTAPAAMIHHCQSSSFCLNKGFGAPMGSVLVGDTAFIDRAKTIRTLLGGTMHQAGIFASAALYALEHNATKLHLDHRNARAIAQTIRDAHCSAVRVELDDVHTNIIHICTDNIRVNTQELCDRLATVEDKEQKDLGFDAKLLLKPLTSSIARIVTHCDLSRYDVQIISQKLKYVILEYDNMLNLNFIKP